ncbi:MAG: hypothetical protein R2754_00830 [Microthrixaceae bacterium]
MNVTSLDFARTSRRVAAAARQGGLAVPVFRSPPATAGLDRTLKRRADGSPVVAIRLGGRPEAAVCADLVDGVLAVNTLDARSAARWRRALWAAALGAEHDRAAA